jgi:hypothetical protein
MEQLQTNMAHFKSGFAYIHYSESVRYKYRFAHTDSVTDFIQSLVETSAQRVRDIPKNFPMWRAQLGNGLRDRKIDHPDLTVIVEEPIPFSAERMKPRRNAAHEGRANPKGIPCLYVATDKETAMSEVRPWIGAAVSLGKFESTRALRMVDLSVGHDFKLTADHLLGDLSTQEIEEGIWAQVDKAFSTPVTDDLGTAEYAPTQVIAEAFRREGFDGLIYRSALSGGFNMALFDMESAELKKCWLYCVDQIAFTFSERT